MPRQFSDAAILCFNVPHRLVRSSHAVGLMATVMVHGNPETGGPNHRVSGNRSESADRKLLRTLADLG